MCLPSDALLQHLLSYLGFSYLGRGISLHGCSIKAQLLLLTLDKGYLLTVAPPALERGIDPLGPRVITFLPRSKHLLTSLLQSPSAVILEPQKIKSDTVSTVFPSISHEVMGPDAMIFVF